MNLNLIAEKAHRVHLLFFFLLSTVIYFELHEEKNSKSNIREYNISKILNVHHMGLPGH